jgi:hypothetical protein
VGHARGMDLGAIDWAADTQAQATDQLSDPADSPFQLPVEWSAHSAGSDASASHAGGRGFTGGGAGGGGGASGAGGSGAGSPGRASQVADAAGLSAAADEAADKVQSLTAPLLAETISSAAPEPDTWAVMILGLGVTGLALRSRRRRLA